MKLPQIETLLLQEMVEVKGGRAGVCTCEKGAGNSPKDDGECYCESGAAQVSTEEPVPGGPGGPSTCLCTTGAGLNNKG